MYNYLEEMKDDIRAWAKNNSEEIKEHDYDLENWLNDTLWVEDSVTGNGSGSYTFNREEAREYVCDNMALLMEAKEEFCVSDKQFAD